MGEQKKTGWWRSGLVAYKDGDHFRMAPDREGFGEEIRPVVKRFDIWYSEFEERNSFTNPVEPLVHGF